MQKKNSNGVKAVFRPLTRTLAVLLMLLYVVSATDITSLHHHEAEVSHTAEDEQDACHLSIFHNIDKACGHEKHLIAKESCPACDLIIHRDVTLPDINRNDASTTFITWTETVYREPLSFATPLLPSRAPPAT